MGCSTFVIFCTTVLSNAQRCSSMANLSTPYFCCFLYYGTVDVCVAKMFAVFFVADGWRHDGCNCVGFAISSSSIPPHHLCRLVKRKINNQNHLLNILFQIPEYPLFRLLVLVVGGFSDNQSCVFHLLLKSIF